MTYEEVLAEASALSPAEQLRLVAEVTQRLSSRLPVDGTEQQVRSPLELRGLRAYVWRDPEAGEPMDAQEYVNQERESWSL